MSELTTHVKMVLGAGALVWYNCVYMSLLYLKSACLSRIICLHLSLVQIHKPVRLA
jgi:hypothetical protein